MKREHCFGATATQLRQTSCVISAVAGADTTMNRGNYPRTGHLVPVAASASLRIRRDCDDASGHRSTPPALQPYLAEPHGEVERAKGVRWTIVLAFYNEAGEIVQTLRQLLRQSRRFKLVLVDNGSTDSSVALCHSVLAGRDIDYVVLKEGRPGQVVAIETGLARIDTEFVATCDADTFYPSSYLATAEAIFDGDPRRTVAVGAYFIEHRGGQVRAAVEAIHQVAAAWLLPRQTHVGGAGHSFRTSVLKAAGGYSQERWPFLLADHEVMHQVMKYGRQRLALEHWCSPSTRRGKPVRWSLGERIGYHLTPFALKDRYFRWLAQRFQQRGMLSGRLRIREWEKLPA